MSTSQCSQCGTDVADPPAKTPLDFDLAPSGSRHYTLLNSNEVPLEAELDMVTSVMLKANAHLASLDAIISKTNARLEDEIASLQKRLRQLGEQRVLLSSYRARNQAILSPLIQMFILLGPTSTRIGI
ncbi:hypothetical protein C8F04DRAFT_1263170 [Mycena alexandri]|uniref:Uncharacterized protein n=1 Tax=Mycena alexandri TaxID=1745969 RepID=A0AAD6SSU7_9AGAR|nr:hypothetical protein C8F04DRAFT_1263170 [Mycena alexandri]